MVQRYVWLKLLKCFLSHFYHHRHHMKDRTHHLHPRSKRLPTSPLPTHPPKSMFPARLLHADHLPGTILKEPQLRQARQPLGQQLPPLRLLQAPWIGARCAREGSAAGRAMQRGRAEGPKTPWRNWLFCL